MAIVERAKTEHVMSSREFREVLKKEIHRSDRTMVSLTFLIFDVVLKPRRGPRHEEALKCLASVIAAHTRRSDTVGWFRDRGITRVGVILNHTDPPRARRVIESVYGRFRAAMAPRLKPRAPAPELTFEVFAYPWLGDTEEDQGQLTLFGDPEPRAGLSVVPASAIMAHPHPFWKRVIDLAGSLAALIALSPLFAAVAAAIKLTSQGPVFFKQERVGHRGRIYTCWKFRTMAANHDPTAHKTYLKTLIRSGDREDDGTPMEKLDGVNREITTVGRFLRKTCIDELPQLINVLRGEMSLVGPRPCLPYEAEEYLCWHTRRFDTVPGMTGLWQVNGKNRTTFKEMIRLDINYGLRQSLWFDLVILFKTIPAIVRDMSQEKGEGRNAAYRGQTA